VVQVQVQDAVGWGAGAGVWSCLRPSTHHPGTGWFDCAVYVMLMKRNIVTGWHVPALHTADYVQPPGEIHPHLYILYILFFCFWNQSVIIHFETFVTDAPVPVTTSYEHLRLCFSSFETNE
jgi:hypothetical protein